jgi:hypothetical protein
VKWSRFDHQEYRPLQDEKMCIMQARYRTKYEIFHLPTFPAADLHRLRRKGDTENY